MNLIMPGTEILLHGQRCTVGAVGLTGGERYYWLHNKAGNDFAMLPFFCVEGVATVIDKEDTSA